MQEIITIESRNYVPSLPPVEFTLTPRQGEEMTMPDGARLTWLLRGIQGYALFEKNTLWQLPCVEKDGTHHNWQAVPFFLNASGELCATLRLPQGDVTTYTLTELRDRLYPNIAYRDLVSSDWAKRMDEVAAAMSALRTPEPAAVPPKRLRRARRLRSPRRNRAVGSVAANCLISSGGA